MNANNHAMSTAWIDPDDAPELTDEFFEQADEYMGNKLLRRGRPNTENPTIPSIMEIPPCKV